MLVEVRSGFFMVGQVMWDYSVSVEVKSCYVRWVQFRSVKIRLYQVMSC